MDVAQSGVCACLPSHHTFQLHRKRYMCFLLSCYFFFRFAIKPACKLDLGLINEGVVHRCLSFFICGTLLQQLLTLTSRTLLYQLLFAILTA